MSAILVPSTPRLQELNSELQSVLEELREPRSGLKFWLIDRPRMMKRMRLIEIEAHKESRRIFQS